MKKIFLILGTFFVVISLCMLYLVRKGVSLRSEPLIKPTVISADQRNIATHTVLRLFPDFQNAHYVIWGVLPESNDSQLMMTHFVEESYKTLHTAAHIIQDGHKASPEDIRNCEKPCWILLDQDKANELTPNAFIQEKIRPLQRSYITMSLVPFTGDETVPGYCDDQKRLTLECMLSVSVREIHKKLKDPHQLYFFMRKYNESDFFLFVQKSLPTK